MSAKEAENDNVLTPREQELYAAEPVEGLPQLTLEQNLQLANLAVYAVRRAFTTFAARAAGEEAAAYKDVGKLIAEKHDHVRDCIVEQLYQARAAVTGG